MIKSRRIDNAICWQVCGESGSIKCGNVDFFKMSNLQNQTQSSNVLNNSNVQSLSHKFKNYLTSEK